MPIVLGPLPGPDDSFVWFETPTIAIKIDGGVGVHEVKGIVKENAEKVVDGFTVGIFGISR